jgi:hypothetical protein
MNNDEPTDDMEPRVREVFIRGQLIKEKERDIRHRLDGFIKDMVALHPEHTDILRKMLGGVAAQLLANKETAKREARDKVAAELLAKKKAEKEKQDANGKENGDKSNCDQGVPGGGDGVRDDVREDVGTREGYSSCEETDS